MFRVVSKYFFVSILAIVFFVSCGKDSDGKNADGSNFVSAEVLENVDAVKSLVYVKKIDSNATSAFAYRVVKIIYNTKDEKDEDVQASGVIAFPIITPALHSTGFSISTILDNHGTIFLNSQAPSNEIIIGSFSKYLSVFMTGLAGFATVMPDYIGYGISNDKPHPYMLKKSSARASIDMLKASMKYMTDNNIPTNNEVYISGYSQGGYVTIATAEELEKNHSLEFELKGVAPMGGTYDIESLGKIQLDPAHTLQVPAFLAYVASSYSIRYNINLDTILNKNINKETFHTLFNGSYSGIQIHSGLGLVTNTDPSTPLGKGFKEYKATKLLSLSFINDYLSNENDPERKRFKENSVYDWTPKSKMNIIHCEEDELIPSSQATILYDKFKENIGSEETLTKTLIPTSMINHNGLSIHGYCAPTAYKIGIDWFSKIRSGEIK